MATALGKNKLEIVLSAVDANLSTVFGRATAAVRGFTSSAGNSFTSLSNLSTKIGAIVAPLTASISALAGGSKLVDVTREFDRLSAGLVTATGSAEGANEAFAALQDFATSTPYDLAQVTDSFVKLVNFGLNPSERAMSSYGNTASALGKDLNQMIEAVADAATGEFERLKEFGIKAKKEGDKVKFTFRGVTTEVGNNAQAIEEYLIGLGETNFGDAMMNRMNSLDGALSNLGDEWDKLFLNISQQGIGDAIADGVRTAIALLEELNAMIVSGELEARLDAYAGKWAGWAADVKKSIGIVKEYFGSEMDGIESKGQGTVGFLIDSFRNFPENVLAFIAILTVEFAATFDKIKASARAFKDSVKAIFTSATIDAVNAEHDRQIAIINKARGESIDAIIEERDAALKSTADQIAAAKKLRAEHDKNTEARKADTTDRTAKFEVKDQQIAPEKTPQKPDKKKAAIVEQDGVWVQGPVEDEAPQPEEAKKPEKKDVSKDAEDAAQAAAKEQEAAEKAAAEKERLRQEDLTRQKDAAEEEKRLRRERMQEASADIAAEADEIAAANEEAAKVKEEKADALEEEAERKREERRQRARKGAQRAADEQRKWESDLDNIREEDESQQEKQREEGNSAAAAVAAAEKSALEQMTAGWRKYADTRRAIQDELAGREKSLTEQLLDLNSNMTEEQKWREKARLAKEYEKIAREAMQAGNLDKAKELADLANKSYADLKSAPSGISEKMAATSAYSGARSSGLLGIDIAKMMQQLTAKNAMAAMPPATGMLGNLSANIRSQLSAATAGGGQDQAAGPGGRTAPAKVHELRFQGGALRGGEDDIEALLDALAKGGMRTA